MVAAGRKPLACEQRGEALRIDGAVGQRVVAVDAAGDEQHVEPGRLGAEHVGAEAVADGERAARRPAQRLRAGRKRGFVDRGIGLAGVDDLAAERLVSLAERARAIHEVVAAVDDQVGVGADERQFSRGDRRQPLGVVGRGLDVVVVEPGADHVLRRLGADALRPQAGRRFGGLEQAQIALGADVMDRRLAARLDQSQRHVAGGDDGVEGIRRDAEVQHLRLDRRVRTRRVGDEDHRRRRGGDRRPARRKRRGRRAGRRAPRPRRRTGSRHRRRRIRRARR